MTVTIGRRELLVALRGSAAWPLAVRAQQAAMPVVGFLRSTPATGFAYTVDPFRQGLNDAGFVEGKNVAIEYRWADNQQDRLPGLAADLMRRQVAAIVGAGVPAAQAGKADSMATFLPSTNPASFRPCRKGSTVYAKPVAGVLLRNPTTGSTGCCARAARGHTAAAPP